MPAWLIIAILIAGFVTPWPYVYALGYNAGWDDSVGDDDER